MTAAFLLLVLAVLPQDPLDARIAGLLERLRADEIERREAAMKELVGLGEPAVARLEKAAEAAEPEQATRVKYAIAQIRRSALIAKVAPPAKTVTVSAKDVPLRDLLVDICAQAGVEYACDAAVGAKTVTLEARNEPFLKVVDRACAARGDIVATVAEGRLKVAAAKFSDDPAAYADTYRLRLRKTVVSDVFEGGAVKTSIALYFDVDAQPDQKVKTTATTLPRVAPLPGGGEISIKGLNEAGARMAMWGGMGAGAMVVDGVAVAVDPSESLDRICLIKEVPAGLKTLSSLKVGARFRYAIGLKPITMQLSMNNWDKIPDIPYNVYLSGQQLYFNTSDQNRPNGGAPLEDFLDTEQISLITKDGTEIQAKASSSPGMRGRQYMYQVTGTHQQSNPPQLKIQVMDTLDRDVEFELKDVRLRD